LTQPTWDADAFYPTNPKPINVKVEHRIADDDLLEHALALIAEMQRIEDDARHLSETAGRFCEEIHVQPGGSTPHDDTSQRRKGESGESETRPLPS
jgi:hypothetical protein